MGPSEEAFTAHCDTLSHSKVLAAECSGGFSEEHSKVIRLKDSDPETFAPLLEYLYRGDYWPKKGNEFAMTRFEDAEARATQMQREAKLYCEANCYDLQDLQKLSVEKMQMLTPLRVESFLDISEYIYEEGGPGGPFRAYFREQMGFVSKKAARPWLEGKATISGEFAADLFSSSVPESSSDIKEMVEWPPDSKAPSKKNKKKAHAADWGDINWTA